MKNHVEKNTMASKKLTIKARVPVETKMRAGCGKITEQQCGIRAKGG